MDKELLAKKMEVARKYLEDTTLLVDVVYIGEFEGTSLFNYIRSGNGCGHRGMPIYALIDNQMNFNIIENSRQRYNAMMFEFNLSQEASYNT